MPKRDILGATELDHGQMAEMREQIEAYEYDWSRLTRRTYPGHPRVTLPSPRARLWGSLDKVMQRRRSRRDLGPALPEAPKLARMLKFSHGLTGDGGAGPVPSAGGLQALELYLVVFSNGWLAAGVYHYDRDGHHLSRLVEGAGRENWVDLVPSLRDAPQAPLLFVLVGNQARVSEKYGDRAARFLLLEAGHLMQNLMLQAQSVDLSVLPCGAVLEAAVAQALKLPREDAVLYVAAAG
jgi:SagB-type dehydrogenase family enzyme